MNTHHEYLVRTQGWATAALGALLERAENVNHLFDGWWPPSDLTTHRHSRSSGRRDSCTSANRWTPSTGSSLSARPASDRGAD